MGLYFIAKSVPYQAKSPRTEAWTMLKSSLLWAEVLFYLYILKNRDG